MASPIRQGQDHDQSNAGASSAHREVSQGTSERASHRYDAVLRKVFAEVSGDPARLRSLLDAMASGNPRLDIVLAEPIAKATRRAETLAELEQMLQLERRIKRIDAQPTTLAGGPHASSQIPAGSEPGSSHASKPMPRLPDATYPIGMPAEAPIQAPDFMEVGNSLGLGIRSFLQVSAAIVIGAAVFLGISAWVHWVRPAATHTARASPPPLAPNDIAPGTVETVGSAQPRPIQPPPAAPLKLPFPN